MDRRHVAPVPSSTQLRGRREGAIASAPPPALPVNITPQHYIIPAPSPPVVVTSYPIPAPVQHILPPVVEPVFLAPRIPYHRPLPWYSSPDTPFPGRKRRQRRAAHKPSPVPVPAPQVLQVPQAPQAPEVPVAPLVPEAPAAPTIQPSSSSVSDVHTPSTTQPPSESGSANPSTPTSTAPTSVTTTVVHKFVPALPLTPPPAVPIIKPKTPKTTKPVEVKEAQQEPVGPIASPDVTPKAAPTPPVVAAPSAPKSWADMLKGAPGGGTEGPRAPVIQTNGTPNGKVGSITQILNDFHIRPPGTLSTPFLEPRGLINTGNMCFMNAVLQMLVFCGPFYFFLDRVGKEAAHSFKNETPLIDAMIMFMREFRVMTKPLKQQDLETFGEPFVPEFVYEVIRNTKSFAHMRRGHQQDAEEFLGFLLNGLHEEAVKAINKPDGGDAPSTNGNSPTDDVHGTGWVEVGHKQKTSTTRTTEITESPTTKIFGGKFRSVLHVPGLKTSVTLEPYTALPLDIQAPEVRSVVDALKHLITPEKIQGDFKSPKGPSVTATKQLFIETLPPVLILHLKRFQYDNTTQKIWKKIGYPLELQIPSEAMSPHKRSGPPAKYRLIGVVYHHGKSASGGHYTVDVLRQDAKNWIRLDDTVIRRVRSEDVAVDVKDLEPQSAPDGEDQDGWVNNGWEEVTANGNGPTSKGEGARYVGKDSKVAYILFYQKL